MDKQGRNMESAAALTYDRDASKKRPRWPPYYIVAQTGPACKPDRVHAKRTGSEPRALGSIGVSPVDVSEGPRSVREDPALALGARISPGDSVMDPVRRPLPGCRCPRSCDPIRYVMLDLDTL